MTLPFQFGEGKLVGEFVDNRHVDDQPLVERLAEEFLTHEEISYLKTLLNKQKLRYDVAEAQQLKSRGDLDYIQGAGPNPGNTDAHGHPLLQFYDFVLTIDTVLAYMRHLDIQVKNIKPYGYIYNLEALKKAILPPSYIPRPIGEFVRANPQVFAIPVGGAIAHAEPARTEAVFQLGNPQRRAIRRINNQEEFDPMRWQTAKTAYDLCVEEAFMLNVDALKYITALSQGLFVVFETHAPKLRHQNANVSANEFVAKGAWINQFTDGDRDQTNNRVGGVIDQNGDREGHQMLYPKHLNMNSYVPNFLMETARILTGEQSVDFGFGDPAALGGPGYPDRLHANIGGPIGLKTLYFDANSAAIGRDAAGAAAVPVAPGARYPSLAWNVRLQGYSLEDIHRAMTFFGRYQVGGLPGHRHPIYACPRLSRAFNRIGLNEVLLNMYFRIQIEFDAKLRERLGVTDTAEVRSIAKIAGRTQSMMQVNSCPTGHLAQYRDYMGNIIDPDKALFIHNGITYLKSNVDPTKSACVPMVQAPSVSLPPRIPGVVQQSTAAKQPTVSPLTPLAVPLEEIQRLMRSGVALRTEDSATPGIMPNLLAQLSG